MPMPDHRRLHSPPALDVAANGLVKARGAFAGDFAEAARKRGPDALEGTTVMRRRPHALDPDRAETPGLLRPHPTKPDT